jgi:diguanylate cyclase (GGDEF)-like protein
MRKTGKWQGEIRNRRKDGQRYVAEINLYAVTNAHGNIVHYLGVFSDISLMKMQQESLERMAYHDTLTKLPNRALFADRLDQAIAKTKRVKELFAVCYMDLDGFKPINDSMGHEAGDELLVKLATRVRESMRSGDTVARIGGDEFGLLFCGLKSAEEAHVSLQRIIDSINGPFMIKNQEVRIRASIGMVIREDDGLNQDDLLRLADNAMYQAKASKKLEYVSTGQGNTAA